MVDFQRTGHPRRTGKQALVRKAMSRIFDLIQAEGDYHLFREVQDCLNDELRLRGWLGDHVREYMTSDVLLDLLEGDDSGL